MDLDSFPEPSKAKRSKSDAGDRGDARQSSGRRPPRSPRNRTLQLDDEDRRRLRPQILRPEPANNAPGNAAPLPFSELEDRVACADFLELAPRLPERCVDLLFLDPPYNLTKKFHTTTFAQRTVEEYADWLDGWLRLVLPALKPTASVYICGDWRSSAAIHLAAAQRLQVRNRITFARDKGRGARRDWKNLSEDIWFCTVSDDYVFNVDAVKLKRRVVAPYRDADGRPRDWRSGEDGVYRLTYPSNVWTDITIPFWSMPENTPHPTQKPEKLLARILLASTRPGDFVLDPCAGAGAAAVVARKLGRRFLTIEREEEYCLYTLRRLELAASRPEIQGYRDGVFLERTTRPARMPEDSRDAGFPKAGADAC